MKFLIVVATTLLLSTSVFASPNKCVDPEIIHDQAKEAGAELIRSIVDPKELDRFKSIISKTSDTKPTYDEVYFYENLWNRFLFYILVVENGCVIRTDFTSIMDYFYIMNILDKMNEKSIM